MRRALLAAGLLATPLALVGGRAHAQPIQGLYVGAGAGANFLESTRVRPAGPLGQPMLTRTTGFNTGWTGLGSLGWAFGNGVRIEMEGSYRHNGVGQNPLPPAGIVNADQKIGAMANVLFDMDIGSPWIYPYLGAGAGAQWVRLNGVVAPLPGGGGPVFAQTVTQPGFAYQAIAGAAFPIPWLVGLSATTEFRYLGVNGARKLTVPPGYPTVKVTDENNFSLLVGLRYAFNVTPPPPPPVPTPAPAPTAARSYLVFFDWDKYDLTPRARQIVAEAAQNSARVQVTRIEVEGNADTSGSPAYNMGLSRRRADTVAAELVRLGVPKDVIRIQAFGDTKPLVPTGPGVREPQNRRVEIVLR